MTQLPPTQCVLNTPLGGLVVCYDDANQRIITANWQRLTPQPIHSSQSSPPHWLHQLCHAALSGQNIDTTHLHIAGSAFQERVWRRILRIPCGSTITYQQLAHNIDHPRAMQAVGNACRQNRILFFIPCHRVVRRDGAAHCGYSGHFYDFKKQILNFENQIHQSAAAGTSPNNHPIATTTNAHISHRA